MNKRKIILSFGAIFVVLMLMSNVSAVQQVTSQPVVSVINKDNEEKNILNNLVYGTLDSDLGIPYNQLISNLVFKLEQFTDDYGMGNNIDDFKWKNQDQKELFRSIKNDIANNIHTLVNQITSLESTYGVTIQEEYGENAEFDDIDPELGYRNEDENFVKVVSQEVYSFFENYITSEDFENLKQSFYNTGIYSELEDYLKLATSENPKQEFLFSGSVVDQVMILFCYIVFMATYILIGPAGLEATYELVSLLLGVLLYIPATITVFASFLGENIVHAGEAFYAAVIVFVGFYSASLVDALQFGLVGFLIWALAAFTSIFFGWPILIVAFFIIWIDEFLYRSEGWEPGDIINIVPQYIHDIIMQAWNRIPLAGSYSKGALETNAINWLEIRDLPDPDIKPKTKEFTLLQAIYARILQRFPNIKKLFDFYTLS